jgi:hypothetical protein
MRAMRLSAVVIVALALVAASCGSAEDKVAEQIAEGLIEASSDENVDVDISGEGDDMTVNLETDEGSLSLGSGAEMPDGLEIPVPDGGDVTASGSQEDAVFAMLSYDLDRYDEIVAFFEDWISGTGEEWDHQSGTMDVGGETQRSSIWSSSDYSSMISVVDCYGIGAADTEQFNAVCVSVNQG